MVILFVLFFQINKFHNSKDPGLLVDKYNCDYEYISFELFYFKLKVQNMYEQNTLHINDVSTAHENTWKLSTNLIGQEYSQCFFQKIVEYCK